MENTNTPVPGVLFLIGGAADRTLKRFVELAGGKSAQIAIMPHASGSPREVAEKLSATLLSLGAGSCSLFVPQKDEKSKIVSSSNGASPANLSPTTTAVYFTGGDQSRLVQSLPAELLTQVKELYRKGGIIGGTSAGAAAAAATMIAGGMDDGLLRSASLKLEPGFALLPGCIVDTHVKERQRTDRLMAAVSIVEGVSGIGLDEDTACEIRDGDVQAYGAGHVRLYRRSPSHSSSLKSDEGRRASVYDMIVSTLSEGGKTRL